MVKLYGAELGWTAIHSAISRAGSGTQAVNHLPSVPVIHSCRYTPQLSRIGFLKMSLHGDIHSLAQQKGCSQARGKEKNELTNVGQDMCFSFFFSFDSRELKRLCDSLKLKQAPFFKMHMKDDNLFPEYRWLIEPLNKLLENARDGGGFSLNF